jgi:hypothetical protein
LTKAVKGTIAMEATQSHTQVLKGPQQLPLREHDTRRKPLPLERICLPSLWEAGSHCLAPCGATMGGAKRRGQPTHQVQPGDGEESDTDDLILRVNAVGKWAVEKPYMAVMEVNRKPLNIEVDTGAAVTLISQATLKAVFSQAELQKSTLTLHTYTTEPLGVVGQIDMFSRRKRVHYKVL